MRHFERGEHNFTDDGLAQLKYSLVHREHNNQWGGYEWVSFFDKSPFFDRFVVHLRMLPSSLLSWLLGTRSCGIHRRPFWATKGTTCHLRKFRSALMTSGSRGCGHDAYLPYLPYPIRWCPLLWTGSHRPPCSQDGFLRIFLAFLFPARTWSICIHCKDAQVDSELLVAEANEANAPVVCF